MLSQNGNHSLFYLFSQNEEIKQIERDQSINSKSFLERLNENNQKIYLKNLNAANQKNEQRSKHLESLIGHKTINESLSETFHENLAKLQHYRDLKRNRETKDISMFNKMSVRDKFSISKTPLKDIESQTGLNW